MSTIHVARRPKRLLKVRTGCITCKIRKVKCDESKPFCKRCFDTGRKCDGYAVPQTTRQKTGSGRPLTSHGRHNVVDTPAIFKETPTDPTVDVRFLSDSLSAEERRWVDHFSGQTGYTISNGFSDTFWSITLPQLGVANPAIRHAMVALSSAHARFEAQTADLCIEARVIGSDSILRHYIAATKALQRYLGEHNPATYIPLLCCLLFVCIECLHGSRTMALNHLRNGLKILQSSKNHQTTGSSLQNAQMSSVEQQVRPLFQFLEAQSTLLGQSTIILSGDAEAIASFCMPPIFHGLGDAKMFLHALVSYTVAFICTARKQMHSHTSWHDLTSSLQEHLMAQYTTWSTSMDNLAGSSDTWTVEDYIQAKLLQVQHTATLVWLLRYAERDEVSCDLHMSHYVSITQRSRNLSLLLQGKPVHPLSNTSSTVLSTGRLARFNLHMTFIPPLYLVAAKCRDPITRREAITILERHGGLEGFWNAKVLARIAKRIVEIEEGGALMHAGAKQVSIEPGQLMRMVVDGKYHTLSEVPKECVRVRDARIRYVLDGSKEACNVTFVTAPKGILEKHAIWSESFRLD